MDLQTRAEHAQDIDVLLLAGLLVMALGIMPLLSGLHGYYVTVPAIEEPGDAIKDAAADLGIDDIPSNDWVADRLALSFIIMILAGSCMIVSGATLVMVALIRRRRCVEKRP